MDFKIRHANNSDIADLAVLFDGYRVYYQQPTNIDLAKTFLSQRIDQQDSALFVAQNTNGQLIGFLQLYPIFSSVSAKKSLLLNDLFVAENARKSGVARALMDAARQHAQQQEACWLMLQTEKTNDKAQKLYESLGYKRDEDCYYYYLSV